VSRLALPPLLIELEATAVVNDAPALADGT
jgi:hypothetical protein